MAKKFKKIYVEITNRCNLSCSFCSKLKRELKDMSVLEFSHVIEEIKDYTDYIYLHVKGEPLIHKDFEKILSIAHENNVFVNITTNGVFLNNVSDILFNGKNTVRQINVSLHALESIKDKEKYLIQIAELIKKVSQAKAFYLSLRIWIDNEEINTYINDFLCKKLSVDDLSKLGSNVFMCYDKEFEWPSLEGEYLGNKGKCLGTKSHIAILSNGDVVPCCLDGNGVMVLGNVYNDSLKTILNSKRFKDMNQGFNDNKLVEELCQKCKYRRK